jgi:outer membrane protein TolC
MKIKSGIHIIAVALVLHALIAVCSAITLDEAIKTALRDGESMQITSARASEVDSGAKLKTAFSGPRLEIGASYMEMDTDAEPNPYLEIPERDYSYKAEASQLIWAGGRLFKSIEFRGSSRKLSGLMKLSGQRDVRRDVTTIYYNVLFRSEVLDLMQDRVHQREQEMMDAEDLELAGMVTMLDVRQAMMSLNLALDEYQAALARRARAVVDFNVMMGRKVSSDGDEIPEGALMPEGRLKRSNGLAGTLDALEYAAKDGKLLDIRLLTQKLKSADIEHGLSWGGRLPELRLVGQWERSGEESDELDDEWRAGVVLSMTLLDGGYKRAEQARTKSARRAAEAELKKAQKEFLGLISTLTFEARSLDERIALKLEAEKLAEENYLDARGQYRAGTITITRLGEFNLTYAEARFGLMELFYMEQSLLANAQSLLK